MYSWLRADTLLTLFLLLHLITSCHSIVTFTESNYTFNISENNALNTLLGNVSASSSDGQTVSYSIAAGNANGRFALDENSGALRANSSLNYEVASLHALTVEGTAGSAVGTASVNVHVRNVDDVSPVCDSNFYHVYVSDDTAHSPPHSLLNISCSDVDSLSLSYDIQAGNAENKFHLSEEKLFLVSALNHSLTPSYTLSIRVYDGATMPQEITVRIQVLPDPSLPPVFTQDGDYSAALYESSELVIITQVSLAPAYATSSDVISYSLFSGDLFGQFSLNSSSGVLSLQASLDRENISFYSLSVLAFDQSVYPVFIRTAIATVSITVLDVNDNNPRFVSANLSLVISRDTPAVTPFSQLFCSDADSGDNSTIASYSLISDFVSIDSTSGVISTTNTPFPAFLGPQLTFQMAVSCVDSGSPALSGSAQLEIRVRQSNAHSPKFPAGAATFQIDENLYLVGKYIVEVSATDGDTDLEGSVSYELTGGPDISRFFIPVAAIGHLHTSIVSFDREAKCCYQLEITAVDRAVDEFKKSSSIDITIMVLDENDNTPEFILPYYFFSIFNNNTAGMPLTPVSCNDSDYGKNSEIIYSLNYNPDDQLNINSSTGEVSLASEIRLGSNPSIIKSFYITCADRGTAPRSSVVAYSVQVVPVDEHPPVFEQNMYTVAMLPENSLVGTFVVQVAASDQDAANAGRLLEYAISTGNELSHFSIGATSGNITVYGELNATSIPSYMLVVRVTDPTSALVDETSVTIYLFNINEHPPEVVLYEQYNLSILENSTSGVEIARIQCLDSDDINTANITYSIVDPTTPNLQEFLIDSSGLVTTSSVPTDCESRESYDLILRCSDNETPPLTAQVSIRIGIDGINEFPPKWIFPIHYALGVSETTPLYTVISEVYPPSDEDCGVDGDIRTYELISDPIVATIVIPWFNITHDGRVYTTSYINSDILPFEINIAVLQVLAYDNGNPSLSTLDNEGSVVVAASILVIIKNLNDKAPKFLHSNPILIRILENYSPAEVFYTVYCTDPDGLNKNPLISPQGSSEPFSVINGNISLTPGQVLDYESTQQFNFYLNCSDGLFSTSIHVTILIIPVNDNPIHFATSFYQFNLSRTATLGETIGSVEIIDDDIGELDLPTVLIANSTEPLNPLTINQLGVLTLSVALDNNLLDQLASTFYLGVICNDGLFNDTALIRISFVEGNLNSPQFIQTIYLFTILEVATPSTPIGVLTCTDSDSGANGAVRFEISHSAPQNDFSIRSDGTLVVANSLNASMTAGYNLIVTCFDHGSPVRSNTTTVSISVTGGNNCPPVFIRTNTYYANISEDAPLGSFVGQVFTTDCDIGIHGVATYLSLSHLSQFTVGATDGKIYLKGKLDREMGEVIQLVIQAKDTYFNTSHIFTIYLLDVNDNYPTCNPREYYMTVSETTLQGAFIVEFNCYDPDKGNNGKLTYTALTANSPFFVQQNGSVYLQSPPLLTNAIEHEFQVAVRDNGVEEYSIQVVLYVSVAPENLFSPQFQGASNISISISEVTLLGTLIFTFLATDADTGFDESKVTYSIFSGNIGSTFQIHPDEGTLTLNSPLDSTRTSQYELLIRATDGAALNQMSAMATISISVDAVNRFFPDCNPSQYIVYVPEGTVGELVQLLCSDRDGVDVSFAISSGNFSLFEINSTSGFLSLISPLDFESRTNYSLDILVSDGQLNITAQVTVFVSPVNEFPPQFSSSVYSLSFAENVTVPSILVTLDALDLDSDSTSSKHGQVEYSIESGNDENLFTIGRSNGALYLGQNLDFETNRFHNLTIVAKDQATVSLSSSCRVEISVNNVNDVQPTFDTDLYIFIINNTQLASSPVGQVFCSDVDFAPSRSQIEYSFATTTNHFSIHPDSGLVTLAVDASEITQTTIDLVISCSDGNLLGFSQFIASVESDVLGIIVEQAVYTFSVNESLLVGSTIGQVSIVDSAISVSYRLSGLNSLFSIDSDGTITLAEPLDYESQASHSFSVEISTDDFLTFTAVSVIISVNDTNDNSPIILNAPIILSMEEVASEGIPLLQIDCRDSDSGSNGETYLIISSGNEEGYFSLSLSGSLQLNRSIDYESVYTDPILRLQLTCFDKGASANSVTTNLTYFVIPSNEHGPVFQNTPYAFSIREDLQIGSTAFTVSAVDADRGADHSTVFYQITGGGFGNTFLISSASGDVLLAKSLDHESVSSYQLTVTAVDKERLDSGVVDLTLFTDEEIISIQIIDINDHAPEFSISFYLATIDDGVLPNTFVISVPCTDLDEGGSFLPFFSLSGPGSDSFSISSSLLNGIIRTNTTINYQTAPTYLLTVTCYDTGVPTLSTESKILITVRNLNQLCPVFNQSSGRVQISESASVDTFILQMNASYPNGEDNDIQFVLLNAVLNPFVINILSGKIFTTDPLDFETQRVFVLEILATNPTATCNNTANVLVELINVNEHSPAFSQNSYSIQVSEAAVVGSNILLVHCSDRDDFAADRVPIVQIQSGNSEGKFSVEGQRLMLSSALDIETEQNYTLALNCTDGGPGERSTSASVFIYVMSVNEFPPLFQNETYQVEISESAPAGFEVLVLVATDRDRYGHNEIIYSIVSGNDGNKFILNSGKLLVLDILDFETVPSYSLNISVADSSDPGEALTAFSSVRIDLTDENDNPPVLLPEVAFITLQENTTVESEILQFSCSDPDAFQNDNLILRIDSGNPTGQFRLSPSNQLLLNRSLDFSSASFFSLSISCSDSSVSPRQDLSSIRITVLNTISEAIAFLNTPYFSVVPDTSPAGSIVLSVSATDPDSDSSGHLRFSLLNGAEVPFTIESVSGDILTAQSLLAYAGQEILLQIQVQDSGNPARVQFEVATISVNRTSNFAPVFQRDNYFLNVSELAAPSTILSVLLCYDNNSDAVQYSIQSGNSNDSFVLAALTGSLAVKSPLDFETTTSYSLTVFCLDNGFPPLSGTARVLISVDPENEFPPTFSSSEYGPFSLNEDALPGVYVTTVTAADLDADADGHVSYRITEGNVDGHFVISSSSGRILVAQQLDFEQTSAYRLTVEAADSSLTAPRSSSASVDIQLTDVNDNCPRFAGAPYFAQLPSSAAANYTVAALECSDADSGELGRVSFSLVGSANVLLDFQIDSLGVVTLRRNVSIDSSQVYSVSAVCSDNATPPCSVSAILTVTSADLNLAPPQFSAASYNITLSEAFPLLTHFFTADATDSDIGTNGLLSFYLVDSDLSIFAINSETGDLYLVGPLDFESSLSHNLTLQATDGTPLSPNRMSSQSRLTVYISDVNDNRPFCGDSVLTALYPDTATAGHGVIQLNCSDPDLGPAGLSYSLFGDDDNLFAISNQGLLTVAASLPANVNISSLIISVSDNYIGGPAQTTNVTIRTVLTGSNDFCPQFSQPSYSVSLGENATVGQAVLAVSALDADRVGAAILYSIIGGNDLGHFAVSRYTGEIVLMSGLDRESVPSYSLLLRASDGELPSPCTNETDIFITLTDANDNRPCFPQPFYSKSLPADTEIATLVLSVAAQDRDIGTNGNVSYSLIPISSPVYFSIYSRLGLISVSRSLSNSSVSLYQFSVLAEDAGYPLLSCSSHLAFYIQPGNLYPPVFGQNSYSISLLENFLLPTPLLYVSASDGDSEYVLYSVISGNEDYLFHVHPFTGAVSLEQELDFEYKPEYRLLVEARDVVFHSGDALTDTTEIVITVFNQNDNIPSFGNGTYSAAINSSLPIGSDVLIVGCIDSDLPPYGNTTLSIFSGNSNGFFTLTGNTISTVQSVAALTVERMTLVCTDSEFSAYMGVLIIAIDSSNAGPQFSRYQYEWYLPENSQLGTSFTGISALAINTTDAVSYNIVSGNELQRFSIDSAGTVQLVNPVDRELVPDYLLAISASSGADNSYAILHVIITDLNDNSPVISSDSTSALLYSYSRPGAVATFLSCRDIDSGTNAQTSLTVTAGNEASLFTLAASGALVLNRTVSSHSVYSVTISCEDSGVPPLSSTIVISIEILPVNSYSPDFAHDQFVIDVLEDVNVGFILTNLTAVDRDEGAFGELSFSIISGNELNLFAINPVTGVLTLLSELDFESTQSHALTIQAEDGGYGSNELERSRTATAYLTIRVFDVNDNAPSFDAGAYSAHVPSGTAPGSELLRGISCADADSEDNGEVDYSFVNDSTPFYFDNGSVFLALSLASFTQDFVSLTLECRDRGSPALATTVPLVLTIRRDELAPAFSQNVSSVYLSEAAQVGTEVVSLIADDRDLGNNGVVTYQLVDCYTPCPFTIHTTSGLVSVVGPLDYETLPSYLLRVQALDLGTYSHTSEATLLINILNENDNSPEFDQIIYSVSIHEGALVNTSLLLLRCTDRDSDDLSFNITDGLQGTDAFRVSKEGILIVSGQLDYESVPGFSLMVQCLEGGESVSAVVQVTVTNSNEHAPVFDQSQYNISVMESLPFGSIVLTVLALDGDAGALGEVTYSIVGGNPQQSFGIVSAVGTIFLTDSLDYETTRSFSLIVFATDGGGLVDKTNIAIEVLNVNDNAPIFKQSLYSRVLSIDEEVGRNITQLDCFEADGNSVAYSIESGNIGGYFAVSQTGIISVHRNLTGSNQVLILSVSCSDQSSQPPAIAVVSISILRDTDCPIQFSSTQYTARVNEDVSISHIALTLYVNGTSSDITYLIQPASVPFIASPRGSSVDIRVSSPLDADSQSLYIFNVKATPNDVQCDNPPQISVTILIEDVNEFAPVITPAVKTVVLEENLFTPRLITQFQCNDSDASNNAVTFIDPLLGSSQFNIDLNGRVTLNVDLDYEAEQIYTFEILCHDSAASPKTGTALLHVMVTPLNEFTPQFSLPSYQFFVTESVLPGHSVGRLQATDGDSLLSGDGQIDFSLRNTSQFYSASNGDVIVNSLLDRESVASINLTAVAADRGNASRSATAAVNIVIQDANDNPPQFHPLAYSVSRDSNQSFSDPVAEIRCTDPDEGANSDLKLNFASGFNLSFALADLVVGPGEINATLVPLSAPSNGLTTFRIECSDSGNVSLSSTAQVSILVSTECHAPLLAPIYRATFPEDKAVFETVVATSGLYDPLCPHQFHILSGDFGAFAINQTEGNIYTTNPLDFETVPSYQLVVSLISLTSTGAKSSTSTVFLSLTDINDNSPVIQPALQTVTHAENTLVGQLIAALSCSDLDSGDTLQLDIASGNGESKFEIDGQGLSLLNSLDFESTRVYELSIICFEVGTVGLRHTSTAQLTVLVSAVNDNEPSFDKSVYTDSVAENAPIGTTVLVVSATDRDLTTPHNKTLFGLSGANSNLFRLRADGSLVTADFLDAETAPSGSYQLQAVAYNEAAGASTATATLVISLTDVNEDPPICGGGIINLELDPDTYTSESVGGSIACTDADISPPTFSVLLTPDSSNDLALVLTADVSGSIVSLELSGTVSYPTHVAPNRYTLSVSDGGTPVMTGDTLVYVRVKPPPGALVFAPNARSIDVREDFPPGNLLIDVGAFLSGTNKDSAVYSTSSPLSVTSDGLVTLATTLDYETIQSYFIDIRAEVTPQFNIFTLNIRVSDANDNEPEFQSGNIITVFVREDVSPFTVITTITASDADSGPNGVVSFSQVSSTAPTGLFTVSAAGTNAAAVTVTGSLDRENTPQYSIQIEATDGGSPSLSTVAVLQISVSDVNDNAPVFTEDGGLVLTVEHTIPRDTVIHTFQVSDSDQNPAYSFSVEGSSEAQAAFGVNSFGQLFIRDDLINIPSHTFLFTVQVSDGLGTDSIPVSISVTLMADEELTLRENSPIGSEVWNATTFSKGSYVPTGNAQFFLRLGNFQGRFSIDSTSGVLATIGEIDYETASVYTFIVEIVDPTNPVNTNLKVSVYLLVLDENDNFPEFTLLVPSITIVEGEYISPERLAQVTARDLDSGVYAQLEYHLVHAGTGQEASDLPFYFTFDGSLFAQGIVDRERGSLLSLRIRARDRSQDPLSTTTPFQIIILDLNDNSPSFTGLISPIDILNNHPDNSVFYNFYVSDPDEGNNGTVEFDITQIFPQSPLYFDYNLNQTSGLVSLIKTANLLGLSEDELFHIQLSLTASDRGNPPLAHSRDVTVAVKPYDIRPFFRSGFYWADLLYSAPVGTALLTVRLVVELDSIYFAIDETDEGSFTIDRDGTVYSVSGGARSFSNFPLRITAINQFGRKESSAYVIVNTLASGLITELLLNIPYQNFTGDLDRYVQWLDDQVPTPDTFQPLSHHIQDGLVNISLYVVQGTYFPNQTSPEVASTDLAPKPFLPVATVCAQYYGSLPAVLACLPRFEASPIGPEGLQSLVWLVVLFIVVTLLLLALILLLCLAAYIYYKRQEAKILLDETIFEHPYMIARPLGAYEMQQELRKLGKRSRAKPTSVDAYDEERGYPLGRGRDYHSSDENIDERFLDEYASSESSTSVYGQDYSKFEQMEAWQKYRNMGPLLRQMVERWRDGDNIILEDDESKGEMTA